MPSFPNRCQHIKVNGTQCGCPALRRNQLCYFHKRHHDERVQLNLDRIKDDRMKDARLKGDRQKAARRRTVTIDLPVLEDANSIQVSLMQIMRLIITGQVDAKTAGLLLYALQTASSNLARTSFEPNRHDVILSPATASETQLGESVWQDEDFEEDEEEEEDEIDSAKEAGIRKAAEFLYSLEVKRQAQTQAAKAAPAKPPEPELPQPNPSRTKPPETKTSETKTSETKTSETRISETKTSANPLPPKKPPVAAPILQQVRDQIQQAFPGLGQPLQTAENRSG